MMLHRLPLLGFLAALPLLTACNQTTASPPAAPAVDPNTMGSGVHAALADAQATRERHDAQATGMAVMSFFDPIGVTDLAEPAMKAEHRRELDEKYRRVEEEVRKTVAEAEAIKAQNQARETRPRGRKPARQAAE
jgi:hypothetical protein